MPMLHCYVDDRIMAILTEYGQRNGRAVEELAEAAISDAAIRTLPPPRPTITVETTRRWGPFERVD